MMILVCVGFAALTGVLLILPAWFMKRHPPKDMNSVYGYRTPRSMKNMELWEEGNRFSTELMFKYSYIIMIAGSLIGIALGAWYPLVTIFVIMALMVGLMVLMTIKVESRLKKMEQSNEQQKHLYKE